MQIRSTLSIWLISALALAMPTLAATDIPRLADCIALAESSARDSAIGPAGELSRYQISEIVWRQHRPGIPFARAADPQEARAVTLEHLGWLDRHATDRSAYGLAMRWNGGLARVERGDAEPRHRDFGRRVSNLYYDHE